MRLNELIDGLGLQVIAGDLTRPVTDLTDDSRLVTPGCLFVARAGTNDDGRAYIADAIMRRAVAVVCERSVDRPICDDPTIARVSAERVDQALAGRLAERFFGHPSRRLKLVGVTGTNGKTTIAFLIQHLLNTAGVRCGMIGTIYSDDGMHRAAAPLTTPGAIELSRQLAAMVANGCGAAVAEMSSHALHQGRTAAMDIDVAVFTNLTGDHLDYHETMDAYAAAKAVLFEQLTESGWAVLNADADAKYAQRMVHDCAARQVWCTLRDKAEAPDAACRATVLSIASDHSRVRLDGPWGSREVTLPLVGRHNVINALQAVAAADAVTAMSRVLREAIETCPYVPGRLERITPRGLDTTVATAVAKNGDVTGATDSAASLRAELSVSDASPTVFVDYAHTHDALANVLEALRPLTRGRLIVMFGCGGDRDRTKRTKMAAAACQLADAVVITSDNPRTEDPMRIIDDVLEGVPDDKRDGITIEPDRAAAIETTIGMAGPDDVVLLAGKGHEDYQIIGTSRRHFDDREQAAAALRGWRQAAGAVVGAPGD